MQKALDAGRDPAPAFSRPPPSRDDITAQLERILSSPEFPHIGRSAAFLTYVTEETLAGRGDRIKGYSIAIEVFKRDEGFTQDDPVVRIEAGRLRRTLERYYLVAGQNDAVRIDIPKGGYVPAFTWNTPISDLPPVMAGPLVEPLPPSTRLHAWGASTIAVGLAAALSAAALTILTSHYFAASSRPALILSKSEGPTLAIAPFANLGEGPNADLYTVGLTEELLTALPRFKEIRVFGGETSKSLQPGVQTSQIRGELSARFLLTGAVRNAGPHLRITARLLDAETDEILWSQTYDDDLRARDLFAIQSDVANKIATAVAQPYGIMARADAANPPPDDFGIYSCTLNFYAYRAELTTKRHAAVRDCLESIVARYPSLATAWAMLSIVYLDEDRFEFNPRLNSPAPVERSLQTARRAVQLDPGNTRALQALMAALFLSHQIPEALRVGDQALDTNPNDTELLGEFGTQLAMSGAWQRGAALLDRALALNSGGAGYYHGTRALAAYMLGDDRTALIEIKQADLQKFPLFHAVAAAVYVDAGLIEDARLEASYFNQVRPDFVPNIFDELKAGNFRPADRARLIADLRKAGLTALDDAQSTMLLPTDRSLAFSSASAARH